MRKILTSILAASMILTVAASVLAADPVPLADSLVLAEGSHLKLDTEAGYIDKIDGTVTVAELKANFTGAVTVTNGGAAKADTDAVATDDIITAGDDSLKALIYGDVDRNGKVTLADVAAMLKSIAMWDVDIPDAAADVDKSGKLNLQDVAKMLKKIAGWDDISLGNVRMVFENTAIEAENEDDTLKLSFTNMMNKIGKHGTPYTGENSFKIKLARNEYESCTALLWSDTAKEGMTAELSDFVSEYGDAVLESELEWVFYNPKGAVFTQVNPWDVNEANATAIHDDLPEVLLDMTESFELEAEANQQFVITVHAKKDTPAGMYKATLTFKDADGKEVKTANVYAYVWDFELPDAPYTASLYNVLSYNGDYKGYYDYMLEQNISGYVLPYGITDERADAYMSDPRVTAFVIAGGGNWYGRGMYGGIMDRTDEQTVEYYEKVMTNPEWAKKGLFYYTDEPTGEGLIDVKTTYERVTELLGTTNIRNMTPLASNTFADDASYFDNIDAVAYIDPYINVWCPQTWAYHLLDESGPWTPRRVHSKYGDYADRAKEFKEKGEEIWWYTCCSPEVPYANYFAFYQGVINRVLSWQQYFNDVDGFLYYSTGEFWNSISKYNFDIGTGDGNISYPGEFFGRTGPSASWRLYQIRDGADDVDYLTIAEELVGREAVMKVVTKVTQGMLKYTEDYRVLEAARDEIVKIILAAQAEK